MLELHSLLSMCPGQGLKRETLNRVTSTNNALTEAFWRPSIPILGGCVQKLDILWSWGLCSEKSKCWASERAKISNSQKTLRYWPTYDETKRWEIQVESEDVKIKVLVSGIWIKVINKAWNCVPCDLQTKSGHWYHFIFAVSYL